MTEAGGKTPGKSRAVLGFLRASGSREGGPGGAAMPARPCRWRAADADAWPGRAWPWVPAQPRLGRAGPAPLAAKRARRRPGERGCSLRPSPGPSPSSLPRQPGWLRWLRWPRSCAALQPEPPGWGEGWVAYTPKKPLEPRAKSLYFQHPFPPREERILLGSRRSDPIHLNQPIKLTSAAEMKFLFFPLLF